LRKEPPADGAVDDCDERAPQRGCGAGAVAGDPLLDGRALGGGEGVAGDDAEHLAGRRIENDDRSLRKCRRDRRPTLPMESPLVFYPRYVSNLAYQHFKLAQSAWRYWRFVRRLARDPTRRNYSDLALTPVVEDDSDSFELFSATAGARSAAAKARGKTEPRAGSKESLVNIAP